MTGIALYGISNCDQIKRARDWMEARAIPYLFHDFRKKGIHQEMIAGWLTRISWDSLINRKGTTWRSLSAQQQAAIVDAASAMQLMLERPSVIKRPVLAIDHTIHVGFSDSLYQQIFAKQT